MQQYNAIVTLDQPHTDDLVDQVHDGPLADYHATTSTDDLGRARITISIPADNLAQAGTTVRALLAGHPDQIRLDLMTTTEYDRCTDGELLSITEAATALGITRQAVQARITRGSLTARQIGTQWVIPATVIKS